MRKILVFLVLLLCPLAAHAEDKLLFAADLIRHGDRTPLSEFPAEPHVWPLGFGQLTPRGMRQEYNLGAAMRAEYVDRYHLLPSSYTVGTLYVRSSDVDRTLMSAQCVLAGLYPHGTGPVSPDDGKPALPDFAQPIPVHTVAAGGDTLIIPDRNSLDEIVARHVKTLPQWKAREAALRPEFPRWSKVLGVKINGLEDLIGIGDALYIRSLYNVPPPSALSADDVKTLIDAFRWTFIEKFRPAEVGQAVKLLTRQLASYIADAADGKTPLKYVLVSGHDTTLLAEMTALGAPLAVPPPYASRLNIELFDTDNNGKIVKVAFNGAPVQVKGCAADYCTLSQFMALAQ